MVGDENVFMRRCADQPACVHVQFADRSGSHVSNVTHHLRPRKVSRGQVGYPLATRLHGFSLTGESVFENGTVPIEARNQDESSPLFNAVFCVSGAS